MKSPIHTINRFKYNVNLNKILTTLIIQQTVVAIISLDHRLNQIYKKSINK